MKSTLLKTLLGGGVSLVLAAAASGQTVLRQGSHSPPGTVFYRQWLGAVRALGEKSVAAVTAMLPPEAARLRDPLHAQIQQALR